MTYYHSRKLNQIEFSEAIDRITESLKKEGFGILTEIDIQQTLKNKLNEDFRPYRILGACNPPFAFEALKAEDKVGAMLPCNVIVQQLEDGVEIAAIDPVASMQAIDNPDLEGIAGTVRDKLKTAVNQA
jgi:uncharacterized protein (DUF302 family)